jgi:UDP-N-acetyl-D-glucosamine dehydrogenase
MTERFLALGRYAAGTGADAILFTCSAFGPCIEAVAADLAPMPVLKPNEAMIEEALTAGRRIGLLVTFPGTIPSMTPEFPAGITVVPKVAEGGLAALDAGDTATHDRLAAEAAKDLADCDAILVCVPTPLGAHREPDLKYVRVTAEQIAKHLRPGQLVVLESTTYPGTTREELLPRLSGTGLTCGVDFFLAFSPEREDPGNERFSTREIPKVVGGADEASLEAARKLYEAAMDKVVPVSSCEVAEAGKLLENIFRSVNIALVNELKVVFDRMNIDIWEVIEAAKTKPFGFMPFYPGPGVGGHCIPLDPFYLSWKAAEHGAWARFIELAGEINTSMPRYVVSKAVAALNQQGKSIRGATILILGIAYKPDVDDYRESPSFEIVELLREMNAEVSYCDPYVPQVGRTRKHDVGMTSVPCTAEEFGRYDAIVIATAHRQFRDQGLYRNAQLVVDTQNVVSRDSGIPVTRA